MLPKGATLARLGAGQQGAAGCSGLQRLRAGVTHCVVESHCSAMFTAVLFSLAGRPRGVIKGLHPRMSLDYFVIVLDLIKELKTPGTVLIKK